MKIFDDVLSGRDVAIDKRIEAFRKWLKSFYGLHVTDREVLEELVSVHEHEGSKHLGHPAISSSFVSGVVQTVRMPDGWHLAFRASTADEMTLVHPNNEGSWSHPLNRRAVSSLKTLLAKGKLKKEPEIPAGSVMVDVPTAVLGEQQFEIMLPEDNVSDEDSGFEFDNAAAGLGIFSGSGITIDLSGIASTESEEK